MASDGPIPEYTQEEMESDFYTWKNLLGDKKIKFFVFIINSSIGDQDRYSKQKLGDYDIDYGKLKKGFIDFHLSDKAPVVIKQNRRKEELDEAFTDLTKDEALLPIDCFCFVFLTFSSMEGGQRMLHLDDGKISVDDILEKASHIPPMRGKPKIFLIQADDISLLRDFKTKELTRVEEPERKVIPTDADRITIMSTIPREGYAKEGEPSFLIQAFLKVMASNRKLPEAEKEDMLSLTVSINEEVARLIDTSTCERTKQKRKELQVPAVISTLRKLLKI